MNDTLAIILSFGLISLLITVSSLESTIDAKCATLGYPSSKVTIDFKSYCIKRVDQTDVVVRLKDVK